MGVPQTPCSSPLPQPQVSLEAMTDCSSRQALLEPFCGREPLANITLESCWVSELLIAILASQRLYACELALTYVLCLHV